MKNLSLSPDKVSPNKVQVWDLGYLLGNRSDFCIFVEGCKLHYFSTIYTFLATPLVQQTPFLGTKLTFSIEICLFIAVTSLQRTPISRSNGVHYCEVSLYGSSQRAKLEQKRPSDSVFRHRGLFPEANVKLFDWYFLCAGKEVHKHKTLTRYAGILTAT